MECFNHQNTGVCTPIVFRGPLLHLFTHILSFLFRLIFYITHVSFEALISGFAVVFVNGATSHGIRESQLVPSNSLQKELSNDMVCVY